MTIEQDVDALKRAVEDLTRRLEAAEGKLRAMEPYTASAAEVRVVREATGAGIYACRAAVEACRGDLDTACERIRKQGLA